MCDKKTNEQIQIFESIRSAYEFLNKKYDGNIPKCLKGKNKTAFGFAWKYLE